MKKPKTSGVVHKSKIVSPIPNISKKELKSLTIFLEKERLKQTRN